MKKKHKWLGIAIGISIVSVLIVYFFSFLLISPGHVIIQMDGDAVKNYFTFLYHIAYEKGIWFGGMNYPYGENVVFTDNQPFLSIPLSYLNSFLHLSFENMLAIMHLFIVFCNVVAIIYTYKILNWFQVKFPFSIIFACSIIMLSPQVFGIIGHFALCYSCVIPMIFYWSIMYHYGHEKKYPIYIFLIGIVFVFFHPYFMAMLLLWVLFYSIGYFLVIRSSVKNKIIHILPLVCSIVTIFILFKVFLISTDPVKDRPTYPWGFLDACTNFSEVFTSTYSPFWQLFKNKSFYPEINSGGEGNVYLGIVSIVMIILSFFIAAQKIIKKQTDGIISEKYFSAIWLFIAFAALAIAMGYPFKLNMRLLNYLSVLKQFRSLGRFSWMFYYIMTIYAAVVINYIYSKLFFANKQFLAYAFVLLVTILWGTEVIGYANFVRGKESEGVKNYRTFFSKDEKNWNQYLAENHYNSDNFQALLLLPFFHVGTEKIWVNDNSSDWLLTFGLKAAIQLHLPVIDVMMSRSSWSQAMKQVRLVAGPLSDKPILSIKNRKPFLLLYHKSSILDPDTKYLLSSADYIGEHLNFCVYACYPDRIAANDKRYIDSIETKCKNLLSRDTCLNCTTDYYVEHFDKGGAKEILYGTGAAKPKIDYDSTFLTFNIKPLSDSSDYEFSVWVLLNSIDFSSPFFELNLLDSTGKLIKMETIKSTGSVDNYKMWFRVSKYFNLPVSCRKISCKVIDWGYLSMDELLLRPANSVIISKSDDDTTMINNHRINSKE